MIEGNDTLTEPCSCLFHFAVFNSDIHIQNRMMHLSGVSNRFRGGIWLFYINQKSENIK